MSELKEKVAVVTGGNSGIGFSAAEQLVREGAKVVIFGRNAESLDKAATKLGSKAIAVQGDVANLADLDKLFATTRERFGHIDVLFVNAGIVEFAPIDQVDEAHFDRITDINLKGALFTVQKALPLLRDGASIIFNTSVVNQIGLPAASVYSATKAALRSLARTLATDLAPRKIRVNAVSPGLIRTPILSRTGLPEADQQAFGKQVSEQTPLARVGEPEEIASAVVFLAGQGSSYVNGAELAVDGGFAQV
ncbi:MAG: glucose 1-dehydrogenase [Gammaproteobacteria bacterium]|nr:glucose 1-dehydrogenase [Gammaproteobacteria bacterium]MDH3767588.1 glucose 1-dehydrogenase [Gammaproteobacteria bacterium]